MRSIRLATIHDLPRIMTITDMARQFMRSEGNTSQWVNGYPSQEFMTSEIEQGHCFVCIHDNDEVFALFCLIEGEDPTYDVIEDGSWINDEPYATIHRFASDGTMKGVSDFVFDWCKKHHDNIRVDTHEDNAVMRRALTRNKFKECGVIYVADGTPRIAYQWSKGF